MSQSSTLRLRHFRQALQRFHEALALPPDPIVRDACIQRFEFTFETSWKAVQADALAEGIECSSPRDCFRAAFRLGMIDQLEPLWFKMIEDRSRTSHTYDEESAEAIYRALSGYAQLFSTLLLALQRREKLRAAEEPPLFRDGPAS